jgi:hypothetical protein
MITASCWEGRQGLCMGFDPSLSLLEGLGNLCIDLWVQCNGLQHKVGIGVAARLRSRKPMGAILFINQELSVSPLGLGTFLHLSEVAFRFAIAINNLSDHLNLPGQNLVVFFKLQELGEFGAFTIAVCQVTEKDFSERL